MAQARRGQEIFFGGLMTFLDRTSSPRLSDSAIDFAQPATRQMALLKEINSEILTLLQKLD